MPGHRKNPGIAALFAGFTGELVEPLYVTIAETAELVLALTAWGNFALAEIVFGWMGGKQFDDQTFWCGYTYPDMIVWPEEKVSWTNAVVLMAADALYGLSRGHTLFYHPTPPGDRQHCGTRRVW